jgi:hypothetical protein
MSENDFDNETDCDENSIIHDNEKIFTSQSN